MGEFFFFVFELIDGVWLTFWERLELFEIALKDFDFGVHGLDFLFGSLLSFFGEFKDFEGLFELLFQICNCLGVLLREFEGES